MQTSFLQSTDLNHEASLVRSEGPLAYQMRPQSWDDFVGQEHLLKKYPFLKGKHLPGLIFYGPPGTGKTTLAHILALNSHKKFYPFNAVLSGVPELKKLIADIKQNRDEHGSILFIDEIHRFNKAQQDALLPFVEEGAFTFIGATTEYPKVAINQALLSRLHIIELKKLKETEIEKILQHALLKKSAQNDQLQNHNRELFINNPEWAKLISFYSGGDARASLNILEAALLLPNLDKSSINQLISENARIYDKGADRHYDVISAFIKSMRGSDPNSALLWLAVMIDGGEDPVFIARRLIIFASEDIGNADPSALPLATSGLTAVLQIGMPEARIVLAQVTAYLASTFKSNASYTAINHALEYVREHTTIEVPDHLKSTPPPGASTYLYPHDFKGHYVPQSYGPADLPKFYHPTEEGKEIGIKKRLEQLDEICKRNQ